MPKHPSLQHKLPVLDIHYAANSLCSQEEIAAFRLANANTDQVHATLVAFVMQHGDEDILQVWQQGPGIFQWGPCQRTSHRLIPDDTTGKEGLNL